MSQQSLDSACSLWRSGVTGGSVIESLRRGESCRCASRCVHVGLSRLSRASFVHRVVLTRCPPRRHVQTAQHSASTMSQTPHRAHTAARVPERGCTALIGPCESALRLLTEIRGLCCPALVPSLFHCVSPGAYHGDPLYAPSADGYNAGSAVAARGSPDDASPPSQPIHSPKGNTSAERWGQASPLHMAASLRMDGTEHSSAPVANASAVSKLPSMVSDWSAMSRTGSFPGSSSAARAPNVHERNQAAQQQRSPPITGGTQRDNVHPPTHSVASHPQREGVRATEAAMTAPSSPAPSLMPQPSAGAGVRHYRSDSPDSDSDILAADMNQHNGHAAEVASGRGGPTVRTHTAGERIPAPLPSPGFGGATAASFFRSHLRAIAFTARLSNMAQHSGGPDSPTGGRESGHSGYEHGGEMTEEQFQKLAESLSRDESVSTMKSMFESLQQFRTLLAESRTLAGSELQKEETFNRIVTRVRSVVQAEAVVLLMVDKTAEALYASAATTPQGHVSYQTSLTHSFGGHVLRYKTSLNLKFSAEKDPRYDPDLSRKLGVKFRSVLAVPVFNKNGAITSVILCVNKRNSNKEKQQFFGEQDQQLVEFIAVQAGGLIENALLSVPHACRAARGCRLHSVIRILIPRCFLCAWCLSLCVGLMRL